MIYWGYLRASKKTILVSSLGLIFSLGLIASTLIYVDSTKNLVLEDIINDWSNNGDEGWDLLFQASTSYKNKDAIKLDKTLNDIITNVSQEVGLDSKIKRTTSQLSLTNYYAYLPINQTYQYYNESTNSLTTISEVWYNQEQIKFLEIEDQIAQTLLDEALPNSQLPSGPNDVFLIWLYWSSYDENNENTLLLDVGDTLIFREPNYNADNETAALPGLAMVGYEDIYGGWDPKTDQYQEPRLDDLRDFLGGRNEWRSVYGIVNNLTAFAEARTVSSSNDYDAPLFEINSYLSFDYKSFDAFAIKQEVGNIRNMITRIYDSFAQQGINANLNIEFRTEWVFNEASNAADSILYGLLMFAAPIVVVTLFVANYSMGIIHKSITRQIGIYKTRGVSNRSILFMLSIDFVVTVLLSAVVAIAVIGMPIAELIMRTDGFLSFNANLDADLVVVWQRVFQVLFQVGLALALMVHFYRIIKLSKMTIAESENPHEQTEPFWKRHYLDLIFFVTGFLGYWLFYTAIMEEWFFLGPFILLGLPTPILLIVGSILVFSRFFPEILGRLGRIVWDQTGSLVGFALKNLIRHRQASTRAVMLVGVLIAFMVAFLAFPYSLVTWNETQVLYQNGAEGVANYEGPILFNQTMFDDLVANYSNYFAVSPYAYFSFDNYEGELLAINTSTYTDVGAVPVNFGTSQSLSKSVQLLGENRTNPGLIANQKFLENRNAEQGDTVVFRGRSNSSTFEVVDSFKYWSMLYTYSWNAERYLYGVVDLQYYVDSNDSLDTYALRLDRSGFLLNFKSGVNQTLVASWLEGNHSLNLSLSGEQTDNIFDSFQFLVMVGQINANIIISFVIGASIILMFAYMQLVERRREIFTERALGMKMFQTSLLFIVEALALLFSGILIGNVLGIGLSFMFGLFITVGSSIPPFQLIYPVELILLSELAIIALSIIGCVVPAWVVTRQDISQSFTGEG